MKQRVFDTIIFCLSGVFLALASLYPETWTSLLSAIACSVALAVGLSKAISPKRGAFLAGISFHLVAFYWVPDTISLFGGFSFLGSYLVHVLFVLSASLQFVLMAYLYKLFRVGPISSSYLSLALAWMISEFFFPRLFPWQIGHSLIVFKPIAACAEYFGVVPLSGLILWWGSSIYQIVSSKTVIIKAQLPVFVVSLVCFALGLYSNAQVLDALGRAKTVKVSMIQGNLSTDKKGNVAYLQANVKRYQELSARAVEQGAEVVFWPESVVNQWLPEDLDSVANTKFDPLPDLDVALVYGTLSFSRRSDAEMQELSEVYSDYPGILREQRYKKFNAAVGVDTEGNVLGRYYKRILMPFGEFLPFEKMFPALRSISPQTGDFSSGEIDVPLIIPSNQRLSTNLSLAMLICYEDLIPSISTSLTTKGANLLVNLTNDAWYGDTAAPHQHHLLAQWRAIENRRYFLRVTNTGLSAIVDPFGKTVSKMPVFKEHYIVEDVALLDQRTKYSIWGESLLYALFILTAIVAVFFRGEAE